MEGPQEINVIMEPLRGELSGLGTDQQQSAGKEKKEKGVTTIMYHQQTPPFTQQVENIQGLPAAFHQQLQQTGEGRDPGEEKRFCNACSRVPENMPEYSGPSMHSINPCD